MQLFKFSIMFLVLTGLMCSAKMVTKINEPDGFGALEEPAINILTNCYANRDKTILLSGSFPSSFVVKLASRRLFSLVLLDDRKRLMKNPNYAMNDNHNTLHKVHIVVMLAPHHERYTDILQSLISSRYYNTMAFVLIIGWSAEKKYAGCDGNVATLNLLFNLHTNEMLNVNLLCNRHEGTLLFGFNPFVNRAPEPWQLVSYAAIPNRPVFNVFVREYNENEDMCKNLDYTKTQDLGGAMIKTFRLCTPPYCSHEAIKNRMRTQRSRLQEKKYSFFIGDFIAYVNATNVDEFVKIVVGGTPKYDSHALQARPSMLRIEYKKTFAYPRGTECMYLITKFRGNKSQLEKIISVIDGYSWIGTAIVYFITLMFFKYFLRQLLMDAILNLIRLSSNMGLTTVPPNVASQVYMGCLLFFVVTMQGIFVGNLAALLTQDIPIQQVDSVQDLSELGYTVYAPPSCFIIFNDVLPEHRLVALPNDDECLKYILSEPLNACVDSGILLKDLVEGYGVHLSECIEMEYFTNGIPRNWAFEEILNKFLGVVIAGGISIPLYYVVVEKRFLEAESQEVEPEPRVMFLNDLGFAFVIFGIGFACSLVTFVIEIMIYRYNHRVRTTRVIFLN